MRRLAPGGLAVYSERLSDLRHHAGMGDRYRTADGWAVEVVELTATPDRNDGERLKVTYCGFFVALVRTVAELEQWFSLAELQSETLALCRHVAHGLAAFGRWLRHRAGGCFRRQMTEEGSLMPTDPETSLALAGTPLEA